jgi:hypothetical protein
MSDNESINNEKPCFDADISVSGSPCFWKSDSSIVKTEDNLDPLEPLPAKLKEK